MYGEATLTPPDNETLLDELAAAPDAGTPPAICTQVDSPWMGCVLVSAPALMGERSAQASKQLSWAMGVCRRVQPWGGPPHPLPALAMCRWRGQSDSGWRAQRRGVLPRVPRSGALGVVSGEGQAPACCSFHPSQRTCASQHTRGLDHLPWWGMHRSITSLPASLSAQQCIQLVPGKRDVPLPGRQLRSDAAAGAM